MRKKADHTEAHQKLVNEILLLAGTMPGCKAFPMKNGSGVTWRGQPITWGFPGMFDILVLAGPLYVWLEAKTGAGKLSEDQRNFQRAMRGIGGVAEEVRDVLEAAKIVQRARAHVVLEPGEKVVPPMPFNVFVHDAEERGFTTGEEGEDACQLASGQSPTPGTSESQGQDVSGRLPGRGARPTKRPRAALVEQLRRNARHARANSATGQLTINPETLYLLVKEVEDARRVTTDADGLDFSTKK
jgi:hypothetical protein